MGKKRAMTSEAASLVKIGGHIAESDFATLIGGDVNKGNQQDKKDVIDKQHRTHSVKTGRYWQIFLYRQSRLETNTILKGIGNIASKMVACIDVFPESRDDYRRDRDIYKTRLQEPMKALCAELQNENHRRAFYDKAMFNGGEVNYLSAYSDSQWHIFPSKFVVDVLTSLEITTSKKIREGQYDAQKVLIKGKTNVGEIEIRTDSNQHYKEIKFRIDGHNKLLPLLIEKAGDDVSGQKEIRIYGTARKTFKLPDSA